jgi:hypothetical protein
MMPATSMPMVTATAPATSPASVANSRGVAVGFDRGLEDSVDETASVSVMLFLFQGSRNLQVHPTDAAVVWGWQVTRVFADLLTSSFDQDVGMDLSSVDVHDLRPDEQDAVRSLILDGLEEHWVSVDPTLNPDLDDLPTHFESGTFGRDAWFEMSLDRQGTKQPAGPEIS